MVIDLFSIIALVHSHHLQFSANSRLSETPIRRNNRSQFDDASRSYRSVRSLRRRRCW